MKYLLLFSIGFIIGNMKQQTRKRKVKAFVRHVNKMVFKGEEGVLH